MFFSWVMIGGKEIGCPKVTNNFRNIQFLVKILKKVTVFVIYSTSPIYEVPFPKVSSTENGVATLTEYPS